MGLGKLMGLKELVARSRPDECPFCGEPRLKRTQGRKPVTCGHEVCKDAYVMYWKRDKTGAARKFSKEQWLSDLRAKQAPMNEQLQEHAQ